jgi:hypothetical protein
MKFSFKRIQINRNHGFAIGAALGIFSDSSKMPRK